MNLELTGEYTASEVEVALNQMKSISAPEPDGMPPIFFKHYWNTVSHDVLSATLSILNTGTIPPDINHTFISLIPKTKSPETDKDFQPISLCNIIYKLISKTIANSLKKCLPKLVSESQSAFLSNHLITDNILVAFETLHHLKNKMTGKTGSMALKLNMSKAYDRIEWNFLEKLMDKLGSDRKWIDMIKSCISIVSFSILINGAPCGLIHPQRGLWQGDLLSPYLFILCAEGLHALIKQAVENGTTTGVSLCCEGPKMTHLFFADDSLLFCKANSQECNIVLELLDKYERASGQRINHYKTQLFFSSNTNQQVRNSIKGRLGVSVSHQIDKYLGLLSFVGRGKKQSFSYICERI